MLTWAPSATNRGIRSIEPSRTTAFAVAIAAQGAGVTRFIVVIGGRQLLLLMPLGTAREY